MEQGDIAMRDIKFRVFDKASKYNPMHIVGEDSHDSFWIDSDNVFHYRNLQNGEGSGEYGDYILMQYTGLKDKNGKEIYEGDIVLDTYTKQLLTVVFRDGEWRIENEDYDEALYDAGIEKEVVGNIYEEIGKVKGV